MARVSKRLRYEILRRDNHTCRYCGQKAPDVPLAIDHVVPEALGGETAPENLVTACVDCNAGKSSTAPDQAMIPDATDEAIRWAAALQTVTHRRSRRRNEIMEVRTFVIELWSMRAPKRAKPDADWEQSIEKFYTRGLTVDDFEDAVMTAAYANHIPTHARWGYFCGICWNKIRDIEAEVREIIREERVGYGGQPD